MHRPRMLRRILQGRHTPPVFARMCSGCCGRPGRDSAAAAAARLSMAASLAGASHAHSCVSALVLLACGRRLGCRQPAIQAPGAACMFPRWIGVAPARCSCRQAGFYRLTMCTV